MPHAYPLMLDVTDRLVVIVGGGAVAVRKVSGLLDAGATRVRVVAPQFHADMPDPIERVTAVYQPHQLDGAQLVFAATDSPVVNEQIVRDAVSRGIWVNRTDDGEQGDFANPAKFVDGDVAVTVSAGSAALSAVIRDDLRTKLDRRHVKLAEAMKTLRADVRTAEADPKRRAAIFRTLVSEEALAVMETEGFDGLQRWILTRPPDLKLTRNQFG